LLYSSEREIVKVELKDIGKLFKFTETKEVGAIIQRENAYSLEGPINGKNKKTK